MTNPILIYTKFTIWLLRYTAVILFIISYNSKNWYEYNSSTQYMTYGLWHFCDSGKCVSLPWSDERYYISAVLPRLIMLPAFLLTFFSYIGSFCGILANENIVVLNVCAVVEFMAGVLMIVAFGISYGNNKPEYNASDGSKMEASLGFSGLMGLIASVFFIISSLTALTAIWINFYVQKAASEGSQKDRSLSPRARSMYNESEYIEGIAQSPSGKFSLSSKFQHSIYEDPKNEEDYYNYADQDELSIKRNQKKKKVRQD